MATGPACARLSRMTGGKTPISNVSDTARWVAAYRARETARPDALFHDPLADRLAGPQGYAIADAAPRVMRNGWPLIARTALIDDLIAKSIAEGCDRVLNLAAGLDTRPYRLDLPADFVWVEADLPGILEEKEAALAAETPRCTLIRRAVDLSDHEAREKFLDEALGAIGPVTERATKALVLTEGLLLYLDLDTVTELLRALARPEVGWWMGDILLSSMNMNSDSLLDNAPLKFTPPGGLAYFEGLDWHPLEIEELLLNARKLGRAPWFLRPFTYLPQPDPYKPMRRPWSGVIRFHRYAPQDVSGSTDESQRVRTSSRRRKSVLAGIAVVGLGALAYAVRAGLRRRHRRP
ncbi:methyltransferase (TIGR00027 family) [Nocardia tenerifensis]|uniref:S-adenosyl-L-methionine-dependent methyltransferase n=1 Tax=Nocardia tenerifensis TaxID=228006 RepID=A0A318KAJ2_9NOCA|nr:methyltransferase (TIGR00027 family) [Nocardia tenerifensis]